jgi:hypothetical protein
MAPTRTAAKPMQARRLQNRNASPASDALDDLSRKSTSPRATSDFRTFVAAKKPTTTLSEVAGNLH